MSAFDEIAQFVIAEIVCGTLGGVALYEWNIADKTAISTGFTNTLPILNLLALLLILFPVIVKLAEIVKRL